MLEPDTMKVVTKISVGHCATVYWSALCAVSTRCWNILTTGPIGECTIIDLADMAQRPRPIALTLFNFHAMHSIISGCSYVGIYGYSYLESGKKVIELFRARGWTSIISDNLVGYALSFVTFVVAVVTGLIGVALERILSKSDETEGSFVFGPIEGAPYWAFGVSFVVGLWVCSVMMNVVKGAVNALIVCWADSPAKLEYQHPILTMEMAEAWDLVFPEAAVRPISHIVV
jgi:hypothetical protein